MSRLKYYYNMLKSICDEGGVTLLEDYSDKYITRDTRIIAKCIMCENSFNKSLNKLHIPSQNKCIEVKSTWTFKNKKK